MAIFFLDYIIWRKSIGEDEGKVIDKGVEALNDVEQIEDRGKQLPFWALLELTASVVKYDLFHTRALYFIPKYL